MRRPLSFAVIAALSPLACDRRKLGGRVVGTEGRRADHRSHQRHRQVQRPRLQPEPARRAQQGEDQPRDHCARQAVELGQRLHPEHDLCGQAEGRPRDRRGLPPRRRDRDDGEKFPDTKFAITDYPVEAAPFADKKGKPLYTNVEGLTYAATRAAASSASRGPQGAERARRRSAPSAASRSRRSTSGSRATRSARRWPCRAPRCSSATRRTSSPRTSARRWPRTRSRRAPGALPGRGRLWHRHAQGGRRGRQVGHRRRRRPVQGRKRVLTSAVKRVDNGVYQAIQQVKAGKFQGGSDLCST